MLRGVLACLAIFQMAALLGGCGVSRVLRPDLTAQGPGELIKSASLQQIDLALLLAPDAELPEENNAHRLEYALNAFYKKGKQQDQKLRRDRLQDIIVAASNESCSRYKQSLLRSDANSNFWYGVVTTATAGLGSIFSSASTVRALSGSAAVASGIRAEYNQIYFRKKTIEVLTKGFEKRREQIHKTILEKRKEIVEYTVERAIADGIIYHDACSLPAGLEQVAKDQQLADDPGLIAMQQYVQQFVELQKAINQTTDPNSDKDVGQPPSPDAGKGP